MAQAYLGPCEEGIHWGMIRAASASPASLCVIPMQDMLGLGSEGRMNTPSVSDGNWTWRMAPGAATPELSARLAQLAEVTDRLPAHIELGRAPEFVA
jgi:4-alpha-glucanotransferase